MKTGIHFRFGACAGFALVAAALDAEAANYFWRGTAENPVWDATTANWASSASATARTAYVNNSSSSGSNPTLDADGATDITVDAGGVEGFVFTAGGKHTLSGGPVTMSVFDIKNDADLAIFNRFTCTSNTSGWGFRMYGGTGTVTVGDGGYLDAYFSRSTTRAARASWSSSRTARSGPLSTAKP